MRAEPVPRGSSGDRPCGERGDGMPDVFELTIVSGARGYVSTRANNACLISSRSTTASRIQSHPAMPGEVLVEPAGPDERVRGPA